MVDIDERVVQMKFDATDFDQNTKKTMSTLDKLREKLSFKDVVDNDAMNSIVDNVQKVADKAYTIVDRVIDKIKDNIANKLVNFLQENTIGQIASGWNKYADMTTAVATLKAQGYAMEEINDQLERLNYFTDETSYNFTAMVGEIGKFTASGQKLEDATTAMMGIADWAALSGKNANEASRAMYQLSQALGAGKIRKEDWKSIQNLNMDTREFRLNAIEAAKAIGTLKDNLDGTYTTLIGKKANKLSFNINQFADNLTEGEWFTTEVMMEVFSKYSEAVDDIRAIYESGEFQNKAIHTTAEAVRAVQESNKNLIAEFKDTQLSTDDINLVLARWKNVQKVTDKTVKNYAKMNNLSKDQARDKMNKQYAEYLKEYTEIFKTSEEEAEKALNKWHDYVSEFGIKAFLSAQEAKTFTEAIESAKDAASTVWTTIYTTVFGDYNEAKEIWTDLANSLYEIFVDRLWDLSDIFVHWKTGIEEDARSELKTLRKEYNKLKNKSVLTEEESARLAELKKQIKSLKSEIQSGLLNGRRVLFQGIYAFGSGFKSIITNFRKGWYSLYGEGEEGRENMVTSGGEKLMTFSEKLRAKGFEFYKTMQSLVKTDFYKNIAQSVKNILSPIKAIVTIIKSVINQFIPDGETFIGTLVKISEGFKNLTSKIVPSQETIKNVARVLRGIIAVIKLIGKAIIGVYNAFIKPIASALWDFISGIVSGILEVAAEIADTIYQFEEGLDTAEAMAEVGKFIGQVVNFIFTGLSKVLGVLLKGIAPILRIIYNSIKSIVAKVKELFTGGNGNVIENLANGFEKIANKAKEAWNSVGSLADVFNKYKGGTGLSNFIRMTGEMLDTIITKIGVTILAIFGLEEETAKGKMATALTTVKDIIVNTASVIRWVYTNILRPVLVTFIEGLAVMIQDLGNQWRSGDIKGVLTTLREIIRTFTSLQLFKMFQVITKVFGSGGLLRLMRNGAKAFKSLSKWLGAKALNEITSSIFKLAIAIIMLATAAAALSYLPTEKLEKFKSILITFVIALVAALGAVFAITLVADRARWGLLNFALAMFSVVATVFIFIVAIKKLHDLMTSLFVSKGKDKEGNNIVSSTPEILVGILAAIAPILLVIGGIFAIMRIIKAIGGSGIFVSMALSIAGLAIGVAMLVGAMDNMIEMLQHYDLGLILLSMSMILLFFLGLAAMTRVIGTFNIADKKAFSGVAAGISMAITIAALALIIRMVLIPTLDTIIENSDKFGEYFAAMTLIIYGMIGIMGTIALINYQSGFFKNMSAALLIVVVMNYIKNVVVPLIRSLGENPIPASAWDSIKMLSVMIFVIAGAIFIISKGIAKIIEAVAKIDFKAFGYCILMIGAVILGIIGLNAVLESNGLGIDIATIGIILGVIAAVLLMFGIFAWTMTKAFKDGSMLAFAKILQGIALIIGTITLGIMAILAEFKLLYADDTGTGILVMLTFIGGITAAIAIMCVTFGNAVKKVTEAMSVLTLEGADKIKDMFKQLATIFIVIAAGIILFVLESKLFDSALDMLWPTLILVGGIVGTLWLVFRAFSNLLYSLQDVISSYNVAGGQMIADIIKNIFIGIVAIMAAIVLGSVILAKTYENNILDSIVPAAELVIAAAGSFWLVALAVGNLVKSLNNYGVNLESYSKITSMIIAIGLIITVLSIVMAAIIGAFSGTDGDNNIKNALAVFGPLILLFWSFVGGIKALTPIADKFVATGLKLAAVIAAIAASLILLGTAIAVIKEMFSPGSTFLSQGGFAISKNIVDGEVEGLEDGQKRLKKAIDDNDKTMQDETESNNKIDSPSKVWKKYGYYIDKGLELGIKKDTKLAKSASKALAVATNESFQKELGIQSPSKVFYENGKFVIRGFINGANSEYQKNKDIGSAIGEGFAEEAKKGITDAYKDIFMNEEMDEYINKAGNDLGKSFIDSIFGGEETEINAQLTAAEQYGISTYKNNIKNWQDEINRLALEPVTSREEDENKSKKVTELRNKIKAEQAKIDAIVAKSGKKKVTSGGLWDVFGNFVDGLKDNVKISSAFDSFGGWVTEKLGGLFGDGGSEVGNIIDIVGGLITGVSKDGKTTDALNSTVDNIVDKFTTGENASKWSAMGSKIGDTIGESLNTALWGWLYDFLDWVSGEGNEKVTYGNLISFAQNKGINDTDAYKTFSTMFKNAYREEGDSIEMSEKDIEEIYNEWKELYDYYEAHYKGQLEYLPKIYFGGTKKGTFGAMVSSYRFYDNETTINDEKLKTYTKSRDDSIAEAQRVQHILSILRTAAVKQGKDIDDSDFTYYSDNYVANNILRHIQNGAEKAGVSVTTFLTQGIKMGILDEKDGLIYVAKGSINDIIEAMLEEEDANSPSKKGIKIGSYLGEGVTIGIEESSEEAIKAASNMIGDATDLITEETIAGLNGMTSMLDKEITPTVTPVFDSVELQNGVSQINSAVDSMQPRVDAAIGSFGVEQTDYTNSLTALANRINSTNDLVNTLIGMLEGGAGVNVHVTAEADPANIYNFVVDENRREFKRTGRNQLAY